MPQLSEHKRICHNRKQYVRTLSGIPITTICFVLDILSAIIIGTGQSGPVYGALLIIFSIPLLLFPPSLIPLVFVSSWSISFGVVFVAGYFYYFALFLLSLLLNKSYFKLRKEISLPEWFLIAFFVWVMFVGLRSVSGDIAISLKIALYMIPALLMFHLKLKGFKYAEDVIYVISAVFSILFLYRSLVDPYYIAIVGEYSTKISMTVIKDLNTNTASQLVVINFFIVFVESLRKASIPGIVIACLNLYPIFAMGSRTSFFTLAFFAVLYLLFNQKNSKTKWVFVVLIALLLTLIVKISSGQEGLDRLNVASFVDDQGSGRFVNWVLFFTEILPNYWFSGIGITKYNYECLGYDYDADCMYVDLLCETGVIGLLLFICFFISLSSRLSKCRKEYKRLDASWLALLSFFMLGIGETIFDAPLFWFVAMYSVIGITNSTTVHNAGITKSTC